MSSKSGCILIDNPSLRKYGNFYKTTDIFGKENRRQCWMLTLTVYLTVCLNLNTQSSESFLCLTRI